MAPTDANKEIVSRYVESIWNRGELHREAEFVAPTCVAHTPPLLSIPTGSAGPSTVAGTLRAAMPDLHQTSTVILAEGDRVVQRSVIHGTHTGTSLLGIPPSGERLVLTGINEFRVAGNRIVERWDVLDILGMLQQLGMVPDPQRSPPPADADWTETRGMDSDGTYTMTEAERNLGARSHGEFLERGLLGVVDEIYSPNAVIYSRHVQPEWRQGTEGFKSYGRMLHSAFPDMKINHESVVTDGRYQAVRWTFVGTHDGPLFGAPATGQRVSIEGYDIFGVEDGKIIELWLEQDMLGLLQQVGLAPSPAGAAADRQQTG